MPSPDQNQLLIKIKAEDLHLLVEELRRSNLSAEDFDKAFDQVIARLSAAGVITPARGA